MARLFDSHAHVNFEAFTQTWQSVLDDCQRLGMAVVNIGSQLATSTRAVELAERYPQGVYAAVGLHPTHASGSTSYPEEFVAAAYRTLVERSKKVVALGETGIDFFHDEKNFDSQRAVFIAHLRLANELGLPVVIHGRSSRDGRLNAYEKIYDIVKAEGLQRGVVHCYGGNWEEAQKFLDLGLHIGCTGVITFPKSETLAEVIRRLPLQRLLIETDSPYLAPIPYRGQQNMPQYVQHVAERIAEIRGISYTEVVEQTFDNASTLFGVNP